MKRTIVITGLLATAVGMCCLFVAPGHAQTASTQPYEIPPGVFARLEMLRNRPETPRDRPSVAPMSAGRWTSWRTLIDETWGEGLPTDQKLAIFDAFWNAVDRQFAAFQSLNVNWTALRLRYRPEVAAGIAPPSLYVIPSNPFAIPYDRPIAVLTGPGAFSSGDQVALRMTSHPGVRTFGKSTATAYNAPVSLNVSSQWHAAMAFADAFRVDSPHEYLTHHDLAVQEPVWLRPEDVAAGRDTVVEAALRWIRSQS